MRSPFALCLLLGLGLLGLAVACGDDFETEPARTLPSNCTEWCARAEACVGIDAVACEDQCASQFSDEGECAEEAAAVRSCFAELWDANCEPPPGCFEAIVAFAGCSGLGCPPENGICGEDIPNGYDCRCAGGCGSPWQFQANCRTQGSQTYCDCFLSGPLAAVGDVATVQTTCTGPIDTDVCQQSWGCCRAQLLP